VPVFYDSMIAKLIAWGGQRPEAIARMTRALGEYEVLGVRTTIPFFLWLMQEPDYLAGRYDTTYLDRLLASRRGQSFSTFSARDERDIAIAAALDTVFRSTRNAAASASAAQRSAWTRAARLDALRG
jgi:acetyl/propionyl-CoA carboxylase alpha subunit